MRRVVTPLVSGIRSVLGLNGVANATFETRSDLVRLVAGINDVQAMSATVVETRSELARLLTELKAVVAGTEDRLSAEISASARAITARDHFADHDLICKWQPFDEGIGWYVALSPGTSDPVVALYLQGARDNENILRFAVEATEDGDQIVDLGAHVGTFSVGAAALKRKVVAVDASPSHITLLGRSKAINDLTNITVVHAAISTKSGRVRFNENGLFGTVDFDGVTPGAIEVQAMTLADIINTHATGPVKFIKMDIEGSECAAIETGMQILSRDQPIIWFESNGPTLALSGQTVDNLRGLLERCGYKVFRFEGDRWVYAPPDQIQPEAWVDMIALSDQHQRRWSDRIDWTWQPADLLEKCRFWANLPYENTKRHLQAEIVRRDVDESIRPQLAELGRALAA
jgi:FkbM family methyltransferase